MKNFFLSGRFFLPLSISLLVLSTLSCGGQPKAVEGFC